MCELRVNEWQWDRIFEEYVIVFLVVYLREFSIPIYLYIYQRPT